MRIKCPRCGLLNRPGITICQSCGDDLSVVVETKDEIKKKEDPLSLDILREGRKRRRQISEDLNDDISVPRQTELDWKDQLDQKARERKKDTKKYQPASLKSRMVERREIADEILDEDEFPSRSDLARDHKDLIKSRKIHELDEDQEGPSQLFDDEHLEDYDLDEKLEGEGEDYEDIEITKTPPKKLEDEHYPKSKEEIKRYLDQKIVQRKRQEKEAGKSLAEEYGYKRKTSIKSDRVPVPPPISVSHKAERPDAISDDTYEPIFTPQKKGSIFSKSTMATLGTLDHEAKTILSTKRLYSAIWDNLILLIITTIILKFGASAAKVSMIQLINASWFRLLIFHLGLSALYHIYFIATNGQTIGKMMLGIRLMSLDGNQVSLIKTVVHFIISIIGLLPAFLGFFWSFFDREGRTFADIFSGTRMEFFNK